MTDPEPLSADTMPTFANTGELMHHDPGCRCWPHVSERDALDAIAAVGLAEYRSKVATLDEARATPSDLAVAAQAVVESRRTFAVVTDSNRGTKPAREPRPEEWQTTVSGAAIDRLAAALRSVSADSTAGLDVAWAAAEAALPEGRGLWLVEGVQLVDTSDSADLDDEQLEWEAEAVDHSRGGQPRNITALGPTPADALNALAAALSQSGDTRRPPNER